MVDPGHNRDLTSLAFSPDGLSSFRAAGRTARIRDVATGKEFRKFLGHPVYSAAFSPNGFQAISAGQEGVKIWNVFARPVEKKTAGGYSVQGANVLERKFGDYSLAAAYSPDGRRAISADLNATVRLWDVDTGRELKAFTGHSENVIALAFTGTAGMRSPAPGTRLSGSGM